MLSVCFYSPCDSPRAGSPSNLKRIFPVAPQGDAFFAFSIGSATAAGGGHNRRYPSFAPLAEKGQSVFLQLPQRASPTNLAIASNQIFINGQLLDAKRAAGMRLLGRDADLGPKAKHAAVGKPGGGIVVHAGRVYIV